MFGLKKIEKYCFLMHPDDTIMTKIRAPSERKWKKNNVKFLLFVHRILMFICLQAIAHYEQAADYYKGEESTRYSLSEML